MRSGDIDPEYGSGPLRTPSRHWRCRRATPLQRLVQAWMRSVRRIASAERPTRRLQHGQSKDGQCSGGLSAPASISPRMSTMPPCRPTGWRRIRSARSRRSRPESAGSRPARFWSGAASRPGWSIRSGRRGRAGAAGPAQVGRARPMAF